MKNIFSVKIGSEGYYSTYKEDGTTFMFINKNIVYCAKCNCRFMFDFYYSYSSISQISCPKCDRRYYNKEIAYSNVYNSHLPYKTEIKIIEYKTKLQLKINYKAASLNDKDLYAKLYDVKEIYTFDILNSSSLWEKHLNSNGQLGVGDTTNRTEPTEVKAEIEEDGEVEEEEITDAVDIAVGYYHTLILRKDGTVWSAGYNHRGQLGDGSTVSTTKFHKVKGEN